jgi:rSAM/selenodomain-associated transferase 1
VSGGTASIVVMARAARPGTVKTRLTPILGDEGCARLQEGLIRHTSGLARQVTPAGTYVAFDPPDGHHEIARLVPPETRLFAQQGGDLGERMAAAARHVLDQRPGRLVVLGTDVPTLTPLLLRRAFDLLAEGHDAVLGPANDGGYYLVGMTRPLPEIFALDASLWGGPGVLAASLAAAAVSGLGVELLPPLPDLDTPADARTLLADPALPAAIAGLLRDRAG